MNHKVYSSKLHGHWVKHSDMDPGPMASTGLGPRFGQRDWNHGSHCRVEVHGPSGPRDPYIYFFTILFKYFFFTIFYYFFYH